MESMTRISSMLETARDLTLEAARDASAVRRTSTRPLPADQLKKLLDSRHDREVLEGLRRVISMAYRNQHTLPFFSAVIKNIASPNIEIKKLVYIFLLHHAESEPDTALLSINTIQKSLADSNPQVRALALRVMSGIRVPVISQIVSLGIKRGVGDMSPYVRKAAALAIPKCYRLDPSTLPQLLEYLSTLLGDKQYYVAGAAVSAFLDVCPERLDLIHPHYRSLIRKLVDMDEWGQLATLRLMTIYSRKCFPRRTRRVKKSNGSNSKAKTTKGFYDESSDEEEEQPVDPSELEEIVVLDPDLEFLLRSLTPLLQSRNAAVIVAVARCYLHLGTPAYLDAAIGPLISLLRSSPDVQLIALHNAVRVCMARPEPFVRYASHFLLRSTDAPQIWRLKLEMLTLIFPHSPHHLQSLILAELAHFTGGHDAGLVREAVRAIGRCAQRTQDPKVAARCMRLLLSQISSPDARLVAEALEVVRHLIQRDPEAHRGTVIRLAKNLDTAASPAARASIIWLVGEFAGIDPENNIAADVLRILAKGFANEAEESKLQILLLAAKVYLQHLLLNPPPKPAEQPAIQDQPTSPPLVPEEEGGFREYNDTPAPQPHPEPAEPTHPIALLYNYILLLTRYDTSYDLRDRARVYRALLSVPASTELASLLLLAPKPVPHAPSPSESRAQYTLGSASLVIGDEGGVVGTGLRGGKAAELPDWVRDGEEPDPKLREEKAGSGEYAGGYSSADASTAAPMRVVPASEALDKAVKETGGFGAGMGMGGGVGGGKQNGFKEKTLDDWLAEDDDDEEEDDDDEESEEGESEEGETEEETDEEGESEYETESEDEGERDRLVK
ncbi:putative ap-3 adaptor complex subunit beta protein [Neofusicoccum parvum UCRNP2]|uniref:Putative ap-3 adaptor complex subunit beta protein n=1 Tax=Botryosphaeria parva (strain UCR-NP2) TaxID=1287680 RepID=R1G5B1_BOTPV|nr:putative ap-3 adaptor complex subunit beta protein [Neofusicoccum parvum UCRNP2]